MSLNWSWKDKIGELRIKGIENEVTLNIYEGNALMIFIYEFYEGGADRYQLHNFICDIPHFRRCVIKNDNYFDDWIELKLFKWSKQIEEMASITAKHGIRVIIDTTPF